MMHGQKNIKIFHTCFATAWQPPSSTVLRTTASEYWNRHTTYLKISQEETHINECWLYKVQLNAVQGYRCLRVLKVNTLPRSITNCKFLDMYFKVFLGKNYEGKI